MPSHPCYRQYAATNVAVDAAVVQMMMWDMESLDYCWLWLDSWCWDSCCGGGIFCPWLSAWVLWTLYSCSSFGSCGGIGIVGRRLGDGNECVGTSDLSVGDGSKR